MPKRPVVDAWLATYDNPMKPVVMAIRDVVLATDPRVDECIKWQAPTFTFAGNIASFFPKSKQHASLMFHQGAMIPGRHKLLTGEGDTARVVKLASVTEVKANKAALQAIVKAWITWKESDAGGAKKTAPKKGSTKNEAANISTHPVRVHSASDQRLVERIRAICMKLPEANERISHGEPTFFAGKGKVFAMLDGHHHDSPHLSVWLPQPLGAQEALIDGDPKRFFRPPYVGPSGWVGVVLDTKPDWRAVEAMIRDAYLHVATAKLRKRLLEG